MNELCIYKTCKGYIINISFSFCTRYAHILYIPQLLGRKDRIADYVEVKNRESLHKNRARGK
jgi:hypothetical protein